MIEIKKGLGGLGQPRESMGIRSIPPSIRNSSRSVRPDSIKDNVYRRPKRGHLKPLPFFKEIKKPAIDIIEEAERIQIIIDLGNFERSELNFNLKNKSCVISGKHEHCEFNEEFLLAYRVNAGKMEENSHNNLIEIILPKKREN